VNDNDLQFITEIAMETLTVATFSTHMMRVC